MHQTNIFTATCIIKQVYWQQKHWIVHIITTLLKTQNTRIKLHSNQSHVLLETVGKELTNIYKLGARQ